MEMLLLWNSELRPSQFHFHCTGSIFFSSSPLAVKAKCLLLISGFHLIWLSPASSRYWSKALQQNKLLLSQLLFTVWMGGEVRLKYQFYLVKFKYPLINVFLFLLSSQSSENDLNGKENNFFKLVLFCYVWSSDISILQMASTEY